MIQQYTNKQIMQLAASRSKLEGGGLTVEQTVGRSVQQKRGKPVKRSGH